MARRGEIASIKQMDVYKNVQHRVAKEVTRRRPIRMKCIDVLKASDKHRSRLVAKEFNNGDGPDKYAPTQPLDGVTALLTMAAAAGEDTRRAHGHHGSRQGEDTVLMHSACFNERVDNDIFVGLPPGGIDAGMPRLYGKMVKGMCGPRHAAAACQAEVQKAVNEIGMEAGAYSSCAFRCRGVGPRPPYTATTF